MCYGFACVLASVCTFMPWDKILSPAINPSPVVVAKSAVGSVESAPFARKPGDDNNNGNNRARSDGKIYENGSAPWIGSFHKHFNNLSGWSLAKYSEQTQPLFK